jgi:pSer/pThr/pTyr-binding forkhead associated (FHA) protein
MRAGVPICPRHEEPLTNVGAKPPSMTLVVAVDGAVRERFVVRMGRPLVVGRSPDDPDGIRIGEWLTGDAAAMVSRSHVRLELREDALYAVDMSTNGTVVRSRSGPYSAADEVHLTGAPPYPLKPWDTVELYQGVTVSRADRPVGRSSEGPGSVMGDAPTITMRPNF